MKKTPSQPLENVAKIDAGIRMSIMDVDRFIKDLRVGRVTSVNIFDSVSNNFDPNGLFSEDIFGPVNSHQRSTSLGYIDLYVKVLHPYIYKKLADVDTMIPKVIGGVTKCKWNKITNKFEVASIEDDGPNVGFGMSFFKKYVDLYSPGPRDISQVSSERKKAAIRALRKYKDRWFIDKHLVLPAGIRDIHDDSGRLSKDDINSLYVQLLSMANSFEFVTPVDRESNILYNDLVFNIQKKVNEIFAYLYDFVNGKYGFFQRRFGARAVAGSTRNVITVSNIESDSYDAADFLGARQIRIPFIEALKGLSHIVTHAFVEYTTQITGIRDSNRITVIDPKTFKQVHIEISLKEKDRFTNPVKINNIINSFLKREFRYSQILISDRKKTPYGIMIVYDDVKTNKIYVGTNVEYMKKFIMKDLGRIDETIFRLITFYEYLYIICLPIISKKMTTICRFPVTSKWSHQEGQILLSTTTPNRDVRVYMVTGDVDNVTPMEHNILVPENVDDQNTYPKLLSIDSAAALLKYPCFPDIHRGRPIDSIVVNNVWLTELGADFDGDTMSNYITLSNEANAEVKSFINSPQRVVDINMTLIPKNDKGSVDELLKYISK